MKGVWVFLWTLLGRIGAGLVCGVGVGYDVMGER
jgi:hypothetical protein